jgi:hypothetical protein
MPQVVLRRKAAMLKEYAQDDRYIVCFYPEDAPREEYYYTTLTDAMNHLKLFLDDDSGLYRKISLIHDRTNTVLRCLFFSKSGQLRADFSEGDIVRLAPSSATPGERKLIFSITNINDATGRIEIACLNSGLAIPPTELVSYIDIILTTETMK